MFFAVCLLPAGAGLGRAEDAAAARAVIDKAIQAIGGQAKLSQFKAASWKAKSVVPTPRGQVVLAEEGYAQLPDRFRQDVAIQTDGRTFRQGVILHGDQGWITRAGKSTALEKTAVERAREVFYVLLVTRTLLPLSDQAVTLTPLGESQIGDRPALGVQVTHKQQPSFRLFFDRDSGLLVKMEETGKASARGSAAPLVHFFQDYKEVGGIRLATKVTSRRAGKLVRATEILEFQPRDQLDATVFAKP
ncbi:MAG: hypothetical protein L0Z62_25885 [Gemmataceae bacterium]|nr:hypothetical protein [Gemmataceae bacterium]